MQEIFNYLSEKDAVLKNILSDFGHPVIQKREEGFAAMCHIILEQQVSIASAKACYEKLNLFLGELHPEALLAATDIELKSCGISRQKIIYLKDLADKVANNQIDFSSFKTLNEQQIREQLITIKGVGQWTIEVYLMFCLQAPDVIPLGDIAIKNTLKELYGCQTMEEMLTLSPLWKPYRTYASYIIWHYYLKKRGRI